MKVFVLGATGYIGSVVAQRLQRAVPRVAGLAQWDPYRTHCPKNHR